MIVIEVKDCLKFLNTAYSSDHLLTPKLLVTRVSFDLDGFLSADITQWVAKHRAEHSTWFGLCERLNRLAFSQLKQLNVASDDRTLVLRALLFVRALSAYQAALLLAERGMTLEARVLARTCLEALFHLGALTNEPDRVDDFIDDEITGKRRLARALRSLPEEHCFNEDLDERLKDYLAKTDGHNRRNLVVEVAAKAAGLQSVYDVYYRSMSNDAAHPTLTALRRFVYEGVGGEMRGFRLDPEVSDMENTVATIAVMGVYLTRYGSDLVEGEGFGAEIEACWALYKECKDGMASTAAQ